MMSTPSSVTSPAMQAILVVPMSRPTMISLLLDLAMAITSILREGDGDVVGAGVEVDRAGAGALVVGQAGPRGVERVHARGQPGAERAELDRDRLIVGVERDGAVGIDVELADRGAGGR